MVLRRLTARLNAFLQDCETPSDSTAPLGAVLAEVQSVVTTLDELVTATGLAPADLAARLLELELAGFVHQVAEGYIRRPFSRSW
ncbi:MAG: hypothetical protein VB948_14855 [Pseudomonadales bacterium]